MTNQGRLQRTAEGSNRTDAAAGSDRERRRVDRHEVSLPAKVRIPLEEKGGGVVLSAKASIENISLSGASVHMPNVKRQHAQILMRRQRRLLLIFEPPGLDGTLVLSGEVVWADYRTDAEPHHAYLGVHLTNQTHPDEMERLNKFIAILEKQKQAPTP